MKRIGVLTSGGDAPGMNAAIRSVVRAALAQKCEVMGFRGGFDGLVTGNADLLSSRDVGEVMQRGGTMLGSSRSEEFRTEAGQLKALANLERLGVEGLVIIGGNGTQMGAQTLAARGFAVAGVASTIDNDLYGFDRTLGVDTALNIALEAIDRLKTTASSHGRGFMVEVMGRDHGYLALMAGLAGGAEAIVLPEVPFKPADLTRELREASDRGKPHLIVVVAEGARFAGESLEAYVETHQREIGFDLRVTKLGHVQRGGIPTVADRLLGLESGYEAAVRLMRGENGIVVGLHGGRMGTMPLAEVAGRVKQLDLSLLEVADVLAR